MVIQIDGSWGEGGGQIVRLCVALSAIIRTPIIIDNIRYKRSPSGLRPQHETAVRAVARMTDADVKGLAVGSTKLEFSPRNLKGGKLFFDSGTAASTSLILQSIMPITIFANDPVQLEIHGGTNNPWAPITDYLQEVLLPTINKMRFRGSIHLLKRGFYPQGGGIVTLTAQPMNNLTPILLKEKGKIQKIRGLSYSSRLPFHIVERMAKSANKTLLKNGYNEAIINLESLQPKDSNCALNSGCGLILFAELSSGAVIAGDSLGELGKPAEQVGYEAARNLYEQLRTDSPIDKHLGDQLIVYMGLASGSSEIKVSQLTLHTLTCIHIVESILNTRFKVLGERDKPATIICDGIGQKGFNL